MNLRKIIREELENPLAWISEVPEPFQIETTPFKGESKKYWITKGEKIKTGDFVVYQTASGLWREYGIMNPEKVDNANEANSEYYKVLKVVNESEEDNPFQWIKDIKLELPKNENWVIINDVDQESLEVSKEIQNFLFEQGYTWLSGSQSFLANKVASISHSKKRNRFTYMPNGSSIKEIINFYKTEMEDVVFYYWSQLSKGDFN